MKPTAILSSLLVTVGLLVTANSYAATSTTFTPFDTTKNRSTLQIRYKSWSDSAFGDLGWTHTSKWGSFSAQEGQIVTIVMKAKEVGIHPGATVWFRGAADTAPDNFVPDHVYIENAAQFKYGAVDEATGALLGDIVMEHVVHGYDQDANTLVNKKLRGIRDNVNGRLILKFKAKKSGNYVFVLGGINPDPNIDPTVGHDVDVTVNIK